MDADDALTDGELREVFHEEREAVAYQEAKAQPPVTAPTPERRVGEARVAELAALEIVDEALGLSAEVQCQRILYNEKVRAARDLLDERAAVVRLTAEVERLRGALVKVRAHTAHTKASPDELHIGLLASIERIADAALSLPTPAPEATDGK